jgi:hypothetical protein
MVKRLKVLTSVAVASCLLAIVLLAAPASAASGATTSGACGKNTTFFLMPTWYKYLDVQGAPPNCTIEFSQQVVDDNGNINDSFDYGVIWKIGVAVIEMLLTLAGLVAFIFVLIGAFQFTTAQGSPDRVAKARKTVTNGVVGALVGILASRVIGYIAAKFAVPSGRAYGLVNAGTDSAIKDALNIALTALGALSVLVLTISGLQFVLSSANPDKVAKARNAIYYALTGLAVAIFGAALINFIIGRVS